MTNVTASATDGGMKLSGVQSSDGQPLLDYNMPTSTINAFISEYFNGDLGAEQGEGEESIEGNSPTSPSELIDDSWTLARTPGLVSKTYGEAAEAAGKMGAMEVLGKATGTLSLYNDFKEFREAYDKGNTWGAAWSATKGVMQIGFLLGGGEEIELAWNLGTMAVDGIIAYNKKE